jgi:hypothetical protein
MCRITLESLDLTADELQRCREVIRELAYDGWLKAGSPSGNDLQFWNDAEQYWIEHRYVPRRIDRCDELVAD